MAPPLNAPPGGPRVLSPAEFARQQVAAQTQLGRFSEPEQWFVASVPITAAGGLTQVPVPGPIPLVRSIEAMIIEVRFRLTVTVGAFTSVAPEAPQNFVQLIQLQGNHKDFGGLTLLRMSGASAYAWGRMFQVESGGGEYLISKGGGALTRAAQPGRPFTSAFDGTVATHDIVLHLEIPFGPSLRPEATAILQDTNFLLQPLDWGNTLQLLLQLGDSSSFGDPTGATTAYTAFGSASGNPQVWVGFNYALLGDFQDKMQKSGVVVRNEQSLQSQGALGTQVLLAQLAHQITPTIMMKTGRFQTGAAPTGGIDTLSALTDLQMEQTQLVIDNKPMRNNMNNLVYKGYHERMFNTVVPEGYFPITFVEGGSSLTAYRGDRLPGGSQWNLQSNVILAQSNQRQRMIQEYILGGPFPA
jgi:hypothetical protein